MAPSAPTPEFPEIRPVTSTLNPETSTGVRRSLEKDKSAAALIDASSSSESCEEQNHTEFMRLASEFHGINPRVSALENSSEIPALDPRSSDFDAYQWLKAVSHDAREAGTHDLRFDGNSRLSYNGLAPDQMMEEHKGEVIYNSEGDNHFPHLTVAQTLEFAATLRTPRNHIVGVSRNDHIRQVVMVALSICGLAHTEHTKVGNDFVRGVSGGERKRVSIAEMILALSSVGLWDNSTRGLDSATALDFIQALRMSADIVGTAHAVAVYQASQAIFDTFDKVTVLYEGRQIYFGAARAAKAYFEEMGWLCPSRQTTGDFLTSITNYKERIPRQGFEDLVPRTPEDFEKYWRSSHNRTALIKKIEEHEREMIDHVVARDYRASRQAAKSGQLLKTSPYTVSILVQIKACTKRAYQRLWNDKASTLTVVLGQIIMGLVVGSVYYGVQNSTGSFFARGSTLFFAVLLNALIAITEINNLYQQRPIVQKHTSYAFVPTDPDFSTTAFICDAAGAVAGQQAVSGDAYVQVSFGYRYTHLWRNLGIVISFWLFFLVLYLFVSEMSSPAISTIERLLFLQRSSETNDHEVAQLVGRKDQRPAENGPGRIAQDARPVQLAPQRSIFSWRDLVYDIQIKERYVQQQDVHLETSTVREALRFSAVLRQSKKTSLEEKYSHVEHIIEMLDMSEFSEAIIGMPGQGLNITQRKLLTIGVELAAKPEVLIFLDEPTSGLDSQSAWVIVALLRKLADSGQAILATIHQPSPILFLEFDRLLFLAKGGRTVYFGDIGPNAETLIDYFERQGARSCRTTENPAEYILEQVTIGSDRDREKDWPALWNMSDECSNMKTEQTRLQREADTNGNELFTEADSGEFAVPFSTQAFYTTLRVFQQYWRTPSYIYGKLLLGVASAFSLVQQIMPRFVSQRSLYEVRERPSKVYSWAAFILANIIVEFLYQIVLGVLVYACYYYPILGYSITRSILDLLSAHMNQYPII
ncbi:putative ABC multidrug transporter [Aureobasidium subglaciale]|nr:putative ABC multidrug transporter [Aureobasidium subglaciale]KAI5216800.1 putative ABC multidrug transporter [Aureobasidium subglaciale]KAI5220047.1 putative ABC multidrug transporter [Aureobasidium subglaciale]KAI5257849.1 putative ABC multidrug transporter [Aureobasidium subglaciale]